MTGTTIPSTLRCIGVDGCPGGWVAVSRQQAGVRESLAELITLFKADVVALDMPIGLPTREPRACEAGARRLLGRPRAASVFPVPMRAALDGTSHDHASDLNQAVSGRRLSAQTYNILDKIRAVDTLLGEQSSYRSRVWEVHPELAFACMNTRNSRLGPLADGKKSPTGAAQRQQLVAAYFGAAAFATAWEAVRTSRATKDDVADAFACLFSAERIAAGRHVTLSGEPTVDERGLPMRICY